jgi:hypothetical protein
MADFTRRGFLGQVSLATGVGIAGGLGLHRFFTNTVPPTSSVPSTPSSAYGPSPVTAEQSSPGRSLTGVSLAGPMLVHVRNVATGELAMMVGTRELIYRDPELVQRLVTTAVSAGGKEG